MQRAGNPRRTISRATAGWNPRQLRSLLGWFDGKDASTITLAPGVSEWRDKSGHDYHCTQAAGAYQPTFSAGQGVVFNGYQVLEVSIGIAEAESFECFFVGRSNPTYAPTTFPTLLGNYWSSSLILGIEADSEEMYSYDPYGSAYPGYGWTVNELRRGKFKIDGSLGLSVAMDADNYTYPYYTFSDSASTYFYSLGNYGGMETWPFGTVCEIFFVAGEASAADGQRAMNYLQNKWGVY